MSAQPYEQVSDRLRSLEQRVDLRFDAVDRKFDAVDRRFEGVELRLTALDQKVDARFDAVDKKFSTVFMAMWGNTAVIVAAIIAVILSIHR